MNLPIPQGIKVPSLSRKDIQEITRRVRASIDWDKPWFPVVQFLEFGLPKLFPGFLYEVLPRSCMGENHGATFPEKNLIQIREDVYEGADSGNGRDRLTVCHEIGHFFLHRDLPAWTKRISRNNAHKTFEDSEWQADCFAGELLMPYELKEKNPSVSELQALCGVSQAAARFHRNTWGSKK